MTLTATTPSTAPAALDPAHAKLKKATEGFESYFLHQLLVEMRKTVPKDTESKDDAHQEETFRDMMDQTLADTISHRGDFGLGKMMYDQLASTVGNTAAPASPAKVDMHG